MDLLMQGGTVIDGTGAPPTVRDVLIRDGRIDALVAPGSVPETAARRVDATGAVVAPGLIDVHTHSDVSLLLDGRGESKVHQGVTTEVIGNCGFSPFPVEPRHTADHVDLLAGIGDDPVDLDWTDLDGYAAALHDHGIAINVVPLVGHGQLRIAAGGMAEVADRLLERRMIEMLRRLLGQGAFGLSTGLTYVPSRYAEPPELTALARTLADHDALYATHARGNGVAAVDEAIVLGRASGVRVQYSHVAINDPARWGGAEELITRFDQARAAGIDVAFDVYPYDASASALTQYLPSWVQSGGVTAMRARLGDPATRRRAVEELAHGWGHGIGWLWDRVVLSRTDGLAGTADGATMTEAAAAAGLSEPELAVELCRVGGNRVQVVLFYRSEDDVRRFLRTPYALIGSDGSALAFGQRARRPHPRAYGAHARVLGRYVRELGDLTLPDAVHRMTGAVADRLRLTDRGRLVPGATADLVVFDPDTIADRATYVFPDQPPVGVRHVLVNGTVVIEDGHQSDARPGRVLRAR